MMDSEQSAHHKNKRIRLSHAHRMATYIHPLSGAHLQLLASIKGFLDADERYYRRAYFVAWQPPNQKTISRYFLTSEYDEAKHAFQTTMAHGEPPKEKRFYTDYQETQVRDFTISLMDMESSCRFSYMRELTERIADAFNLCAPQVNRCPPSHPEYADYHGWALTDDNELWVCTQKKALVIHEQAHIVDGQILKNNWVDHGPSFMAGFIFLLSRYGGYREKMLREKARDHNIDVAQIDFNEMHAELLLPKIA